VTIQNKDITVQGAGAGSTVISGNGFSLRTSGSRVTGFTFTLGGGTMYVDDSRGFRFDHNTITEPGWQFCIQIVGSLNGTRSNRPSEGLIDNNTMTNCRVVVFGENYSTGGSDRWAEPLDLGTAHAVYIEDNAFAVTNCPQGNSGVLCNFADSNTGGRFVARFNSIINSYFEAHSAGNNTRGTRLVEIYNNSTTLQNYGSVVPVPGFYHPFFMRAGTHMIFHNTFNEDHSGTDTIDVDNERSYDTTITWGLCNGTRFVDSNVSGQSGRLCRDQVGALGDQSYWGSPWSTPASVQIPGPSYQWRNTGPNGEIGHQLVNDPYSFKHIQANRDYFAYTASFTGTVGVGEGPLANRPSTCTTGVGYWATDQGEWNSRRSGADGQFYKCTSTNTWSLYYVPYAYPHPLQSGSSGVSSSVPSSPQNLRISSSGGE